MVMVMVMVNVDLYSAIITKVSNALDTLVSGEKPGFQTLSEGLVVLLCAEVVRQRVPDAPYIRSVWSVSSARRRRRAPNRCRRPTEASADFAGRENEGERERERGRQGGSCRSIALCCNDDAASVAHCRICNVGCGCCMPG